MKSLSNIKSTSGFTLIELLAVAVIFAVVAGMLVGNLKSDPHRVLENSAKQFVDQFELMNEEATLLGWDFGLHINENSYSYKIWDSLQWKTIPIPEYAQPIKLENIIQLNLALIEDGLDGQSNVFNVENDNDIDNQTPQIVILSSGETTPFTLDLETETSDEKITIVVDANAQIKIIRENDFS